MDDRDARVAKALAEVHFMQTLIGPHKSIETERTLAAEVRRFHLTVTRIEVMIRNWRELAVELRGSAGHWRMQGESFAWHAIRTDERAELFETMALLLESIIKTM